MQNAAYKKRKNGYPTTFNTICNKMIKKTTQKILKYYITIKKLAVCIRNKVMASSASTTTKPVQEFKVAQLQKGETLTEYLFTVRQNVKEWLPNTLRTEITDWYREQLPDQDKDKYYITPVPVIVFQMVEQNLAVAAQISQEVTHKVLTLSMEEMKCFAGDYKRAVVDYRKKHGDNRSEPKYFVQYAVAIVNNCQSFIEFSDQLKRRYCKSNVPNEVATTLHELLRSFHDIAVEGCTSLLDEVFTDLSVYISDLVTKKWLTGFQIVETISVTIEDYCTDFKHLRPKYFDSLMAEAQTRIVTEYIKAMMLRKITFKTYDERKEGAEKICKESADMEKLFQKLQPHVPGRKTQRVNPWQALPALAEILKLKDTSMIGLEVMGIITKFPDVRSEHLIAVTLLRGDIGRGEARQLITEILPDEQQRLQSANKTFFSRIQVG